MRTERVTVAAAAILVCAVFVAQPQDRPLSVSGRIDALVQKYADLGQFNGSILVARSDGVVIEKGYGMADFEWSIPNTPDTRFRLGSITKQFTSMLTLQLVEEGKLSLDDRLADRLPYYRKDTGGKVTIHHLLNHTSGIPSYTENPSALARGRLPMGLRDLVTTYCSGDLAFEPGAKFAYNNSGYVILGAVIEQATGKSYERVLRERIFDPAGMKASGYDHVESLIERRAAGYDNRLDGMRNADFVDMSLPHAAGALYSTVHDLYLWDQALYGTKLLSDAYKKRMFTPGLADYAYGWYVRRAPVGPEKAERTVLQHGGVINGFSSLILRIPEDRVLITLLNNTGRANLVAISQGIGDILYGREPPPPKKSIARVLYPTIRGKGIETALTQYRQIKAESPAGYDLGEGELNQLGRSLLGSGRTDDAIAIFRLNLDSFPNSSNAFASLGEAYEAKGEKDLAMKAYARAVELNPGNASAVKQLQQLAK